MSLIQCKECGGQVSDQAEKCPHCGVTLNKIIEQQSMPNSITDSGISMTKVETEQTNKKWKSMYLYSWLVFFLALLLFGIGGGKLSTFSGLFGILLMFVAIVLRYTSKIGAWWNNK